MLPANVSDSRFRFRNLSKYINLGLFNLEIPTNHTNGIWSLMKSSPTRVTYKVVSEHMILLFCQTCPFIEASQQGKNLKTNS